MTTAVVECKQNVIIIDFKGFICWTRLSDGSYAVDPLYLNLFNATFRNKEG